MRSAHPRYGQKYFGTDLQKGKLCLLASSLAESNSLGIRQDAKLFAAILSPRSVLEVPKANRSYWLQLVRGELTIRGNSLLSGDGLVVTTEQFPPIETGEAEAELLLFDARLLVNS